MMKKFATELAAFLRRYYPEANQDGWYRFSADIQIRGDEVEVEIPILTRLPDVNPSPAKMENDPLKSHLPKDGAG
ncbi:MAG TPA: hypothetical protein VGI89_07275 [Rhizomicrobium sp.]|jgi:hypothetical protein